MSYQNTKVYTYFLSLDEYAIGDLKLLHELSQKAETVEQELQKKAEEDRSKPVHEGTKYPYDFKFNFGTPQPSRGTIPFTQMIFSCIDILGYLVKGKGSHTETKKNIEAFFTFVASPPNQKEMDCLVNIYRHGLAHNYFPKLGQSISYHSTNPDALFFKMAGGDTCLNVNKLEEYFNEAYSKIKGSHDKYELFEKNFVTLTEHYKEKEKCEL